MMNRDDVLVYGLLIVAVGALGALAALDVIGFGLLAGVLATLTVVLGGTATLKHFGIIAPLETVNAVNRNQAAMQKQPLKAPLMLTDGRYQFSQMVREKIDALPMAATDKQRLYNFTMSSDQTLGRLLIGEGLPIALSGVEFGALTVTFQLKLREFSQKYLATLMKLEGLIGQALSVSSVRLLPDAGYINCEVSSPVRANVTVDMLRPVTRGTEVGIGLDTQLRPVTLDISQHGLFGVIAPSRRGKTQAIRSVLYQLMAIHSDWKMVVVAFKTEDWMPFSSSATLIFDKDEIKAFQIWLLQMMYDRAKSPKRDRWLVVFDDVFNLVATNPEVKSTIQQCASLGAGCGVTTIASTQFVGADGGGMVLFANATARLLFKPASNSQGTRDSGQAGLGLDQLSAQKGDAVLVVDGEATRLTTAMTPDSLIARLTGSAPDRAWLDSGKKQEEAEDRPQSTQRVPVGAPGEFAQLVDEHEDYIFESFSMATGKFANRSEAMRALGWGENGRNRAKLGEFETYISQHCADRFG